MNKLDEIVEKIINVDKANLSSYFEKTMWTRFEMGQKEQVKNGLLLQNMPVSSTVEA